MSEICPAPGIQLVGLDDGEMLLVGRDCTVLPRGGALVTELLARTEKLGDADAVLATYPDAQRTQIATLMARYLELGVLVEGNPPAELPALEIARSSPFVAAVRWFGSSALVRAVAEALPDGIAISSIQERVPEALDFPAPREIAVVAARNGTAATLEADLARLRDAGWAVLPVIAQGATVAIGPLILPRAPWSRLRGEVVPALRGAPRPGLTARIRVGLDEAELPLDQVAPAIAAMVADPTAGSLFRRILVTRRGASVHGLEDGGIADALAAIDDDTFDLTHVLGPVLRDPDALAFLRARLGRGMLVSIEEPFGTAFADVHHRWLAGTERWVPYEKAVSYPDGTAFHARHHSMFDRARKPPELLGMAWLLGNARGRRWAQDTFGIACAGPLTLAGSCYFPGDYLTEHPDAGGDRSVAFVWNLTRDWDPRWGGGLHWCGAGRSVSPRFNTLSLFRVDRASMHSVQPVSARARGQRLSINGWWTDPDVDWNVGRKPELEHRPGMTAYPGLTPR